jgi:hypothetical protein
MASVHGHPEVLTDSDSPSALIDKTIAIAKWLAGTSRRLGDLLAVFAATTSPGNDPDPCFLAIGRSFESEMAD